MVLEKTWQWFALIKDAVANDPQGLIARYHDELRTITDTSFKYREMGDPTDFCSSAAESLFDYEPEKILLGTAEVGDYDVEVARSFLERFTPQNSLVVVTGPELGEEEIEKSSVSARDAEWQMEEVRLLSVCLYLLRRTYPNKFPVSFDVALCTSRGLAENIAKFEFPTHSPRNETIPWRSILISASPVSTNSFPRICCRGAKTPSNRPPEQTNGAAL